MGFTTLPQYADYRETILVPVQPQSKRARQWRLIRVLLQIAFLVIVWGTVFELRKQALAVEHPPAPLLVGKWAPADGQPFILEFEYDRYTLSRDGKVVLRGGYKYVSGAPSQDLALLLWFEGRDVWRLAERQVEFGVNDRWLGLGDSYIAGKIYDGGHVPNWVKFRRVD